MAPNSRVAVSSGFNESILGTYGFLWINERFWISFTNRPLRRPTLTAGLDGQPADGAWVCLPPPPGTAIRGTGRVDAGTLTSFRMGDHSFWVRREQDTNDIVFTVILPHTLRGAGASSCPSEAAPSGQERLELLWVREREESQTGGHRPGRRQRCGVSGLASPPAWLSPEHTFEVWLCVWSKLTIYGT